MIVKTNVHIVLVEEGYCLQRAMDRQICCGLKQGTLEPEAEFSKEEQKGIYFATVEQAREYGRETNCIINLVLE